MISHDDAHTPTQDFREYVARDIARALRHNARFAPPMTSGRERRLGLIAVTAIGTIVALAAGLVFGTSTGYASGRLESHQRVDAMAANATSVMQQIAMIRVGLARTRGTLAQAEAASGATSQTSLRHAGADLRILEAATVRIEQEMTKGRETSTSISSTTAKTSMKAALAIACTALAISLPATAAPSQSTSVPVVDLPTASAKTTATFAGVLGVRQLPGGRVLVNDGRGRQMHLIDSSLKTSTVVIDSVAGTAHSYGPRPAPLMAFLGDSSLFADFNSRTMLVIDPGGHVARALALPNPQDIFSINGSFAGVDNKGRLLYRGPQLPPVPAPGAQMPDSAPILRADLDSRLVDTVGRVNRPGLQMTFHEGDDGRLHSTMTINPLPTIDEWAVLSDGSIAFVRGHDYHVDWIRADGTRDSTPKLPFDWKRLTGDDKQKLIDSARAAQNSFAPKTAAVGGGRGAAATVQPFSPPSIRIVPLDEIADYYPAIRTGAAMPDRDGNLWILPTTSAQSLHGELVYDVVNVKEGLFERVRVPAGRSIAGFGKGGVIYLLSGDASSGFSIERTQLPPRPKTAGE